MLTLIPFDTCNSSDTKVRNSRDIRSLGHRANQYFFFTKQYLVNITPKFLYHGKLFLWSVNGEAEVDKHETNFNYSSNGCPLSLVPSIFGNRERLCWTCLWSSAEVWNPFILLVLITSLLKSSRLVLLNFSVLSINTSFECSPLDFCSSWCY